MLKFEKKTNSIKKGQTYLKIQSDDFHCFSNGMSDFIIQRIAVSAIMHLWTTTQHRQRQSVFYHLLKIIEFCITVKFYKSPEL